MGKTFRTHITHKLVQYKKIYIFKLFFIYYKKKQF